MKAASRPTAQPAPAVVAVLLAAVALLMLLLLGSPSAQAAPALQWSAPTTADAAAVPTSISCISRTLCVAVDRSGNVLTSTTPTATTPSWTIDPADAAHELTSVSCASSALCVAADSRGRVLWSTHPEAGIWSAPKQIDGERPLTGVSCPSASFCVAVDNAGNAMSSTEPASATWLPAAQIDNSRALTAVSCASAQLCLASDSEGALLASTTPAQPASWHRKAVDPFPTIQSVSCNGASVCVGVDGAGDALASSDPASSSPTWSLTAIDATAALAGVSCVSSGLCVAVDRGGEAFASEAPAASAPAWATSVVNPAHPGAALAAVSCVSNEFCAAIDTQGRVSIAATPPPPPPPQPQIAPPHTPHPTITGVPAVHSRLTCNPGLPSGEEDALSYAWQRDEAPIPGATSAGYRVSAADATHHLQCWVTATNAAGSATGHSPFVAIPAQGVPIAVGETTVGLAHVSGSRLAVPLRCSTRTRVCVIVLQVRAVEALRANRVIAIAPPGRAMPSHTRRVTVTLAGGRVRLAPGQRRTVVLSLNRPARKLMARRHGLSAQLTVSGTVVGVLKAVLSRQAVAFGRASAARALALIPTATAARARASAQAPQAPTPYMGWDTYFAFGPRYSESTVLEQASQLLASGLARRGYRYVWLDVGWWQGHRHGNGEILTDSAQWPHGMPWLTATLHAAGLLVGLYTDAGRDGCGGTHQGSYGHYRQDANTFASWGFDAVKVDFCGGVRLHLDPRAAYDSFHAALASNSSRRPMLLSICDFLEPGQFAGSPPFGQSAFASYTFGPSTGTSWRTDTDVGAPGSVTFATVLRNLDADAAHPEAAGPGHWNDPDYLGPDQGLTAAQFQTQISMWAVLAAPLMVSDNLLTISPQSLAAISNGEVLAIDQDPAGVQGTLVSSEEGAQVWVKPLSDGSRAVALLNRGPAPARIETSAQAVGMPAASRYALRDVWAHSTAYTGAAIAATVPGESTVLLRVSVPQASASRAQRAAHPAQARS